LRVRALIALLGSLTVLAGATTPALAGITGGASTGGAPAGAGKTSTGAARHAAEAAPPAPLHAAPITARSTRLLYRGPIYQKTATGEILPYQPPQPGGLLSGATGGSPVAAAADTKPELLVPGSLARYVNGLAAAPMSAPAAVQELIWAGNQIIGLPYIFGGGHASFDSPGYDCSGTVSFALHGAGLLATPEDSSEFMAWGSHGVGRWITVFSNPGHAYLDVAGLRLDTSAADDPSNQQGPRWRPLRAANAGVTIRHPLGY
jgi:cell wall-associated NlpC family hydrolase